MSYTEHYNDEERKLVRDIFTPCLNTLGIANRVYNFDGKLTKAVIETDQALESIHYCINNMIAINTIASITDPIDVLQILKTASTGMNSLDFLNFFTDQVEPLLKRLNDLLHTSRENQSQLEKVLIDKNLMS